MKLFLHVCCGPCTIYPLTVLRDKGIEVTGHFYNPNIHPFLEFKRRLTTMQDYATTVQLPLVADVGYGLTDYVRQVAFHEAERCTICYRMRLEKTVSLARQKGFDAFSTTLLYSRYQRHSLIQTMAENLANEYNIPFYYHDFRAGWQAGINAAKELDLYRQPYCGCIYSERERYDKAFRNQ